MTQVGDLPMLGLSYAMANGAEQSNVGQSNLSSTGSLVAVHNDQDISQPSP